MKCEKLTYRTPVYGSVYCDDLFYDNDNYADFGPEGAYSLCMRKDSVREFLEEHSEDLAAYVPEELGRVVVKAVFGIAHEDSGLLYLLTEVYVRRPLDECETRILERWIEGQISDGWGENLEQQEAAHERIDRFETEFDPDYCDFASIPYSSTVYYYLHAWSDDADWYLECIRTETVDVDIPGVEPEIYSVSCNDRKNGGYEVITVYQTESFDDVLFCLRTGNAHVSEEFVTQLEEHGTFGEGVRYYFTCINRGMFSEFLPILGAMDINTEDLKIIRLFLKDRGALIQEEYNTDEFSMFYKDLLSR